VLQLTNSPSLAYLTNKGSVLSKSSFNNSGYNTGY